MLQHYHTWSTPHSGNEIREKIQLFNGNADSNSKRKLSTVNDIGSPEVVSKIEFYEKLAKNHPSGGDLKRRKTHIEDDYIESLKKVKELQDGLTISNTEKAELEQGK